MRLVGTIVTGETAPAGGAAVDEILIAAAMAFAVLVAVGYVVIREVTGHTTLIGRLADWTARQDGLTRWSSLPMYLLVLSLLSAGFGVWWDVPIHMQNGRDSGPLANPSHYPIFLGILGFTSAGLLSMGLARDPLPRRTLRLLPTWRVPFGSLVIVGAGQIALLGFPADDLWHRLFGQDVTEWGPTHVMMIGGAVTCILGIPLLLAEAHQAGAPGTRTMIGRWRQAIVLGLCIIPVAFLMEFDLGVPQYPAATQFVIAGFMATWIFAAVRQSFGPGGALLAWGVYLVMHAFLWVTISLIPGVLTARFLLLLPAAVLVELVALVLSPRLRPVAFGIASGVAVGTVGLFAEWLWSDIFLPPPQPVAASSLPLLLGAGTVAAVGGGLLAAWHVARLDDVAAESPPTVVRQRWTGLVGVGLAVALMAVFAPPRAGSQDIEATVAYSDVVSESGATACDGAERCLARVTVRLEPADAAEDAIWLYGLAWQGRGPKADAVDPPRDPAQNAPGIVRTEMRATGVPGEYRSVHRLPLYGNWKSLVRLHLPPTTMIAVPLHAPDDPAIESDRGREILVADGDTVPVSPEKQFLQREIKDDVPAWLNATAYTLVIGSWLLLVLFFGWCYARASRPSSAAATPREPDPIAA